MENIIKLLPEHISNQIAAGEVIQRPASVVKELVENAIDAGARNIEVHIQNAGKTLIQVIDDGSGMALIDAKMAFERHATSKISKVDDIYNLHTKGFRGEALPSIASISHLTLTTKRVEDELGTMIVNEGGKIKNQEPVVCKNGTSFEIKNLFFNVPARRNFLKPDSTEFRHIQEEFLRVAFIHSNIGMTLTHNQQVIYNLPPANMRRRIVDVFGKSMNDKLVPINMESAIVNITGFVVKPEFAKKKKGDQYFFVNNRFFKDSYFHNAIMRAFESLIPDKTNPGYFLSLEVNPAEIDVNVHPTKTEIKFENQKDIYLILSSAVRESLGKFNIFPSLDFEAETAFDLTYEERQQPIVEPKIRVNPNYNPFSSSSSSGRMSKSDSEYANKSLQSFGFGGQKASSDDWKNFYSVEEEIEQGKLLEQEENEINVNFEDVPILVLKSYAVVSQEDALWLFDLMALKERLLFDHFFQTFLIKPIQSQALLFPIEISIEHHETMLWEENKKTIERLGFEWKIKDGILLIAAAPSTLKPENIATTVQEIRNHLIDDKYEKSELAHLLIQSMSILNAQNLNWNEKSVRGILSEWVNCQDKWESPSGKLIVKSFHPKDLLK